MGKLYYIAPEDKLFNELKAACLQVWAELELEKYEPSKFKMIKNMENLRDNFMYLVGMMDMVQHVQLSAILSNECKKAIYDRAVSGGSGEYLTMFA